jgi:aerobic carbon-monoxide dehydrogenase medium subunit
VKPARFDYYDPTTLEEAVALLQRFGEEAKLLAGGQSLVPVLNLRLARPAVLIDLNRVEGLSYIREDDGVIAIGAMTRHAAVERSELVARRQPLLAEAVRQIGHSQIRNRGTIGGSLAHADPSAELPAVLAALDGSVRLAGPGGLREVAAADLFLMYFLTEIRQGEVLVEVRVPVLPPGAGWAFVEVVRRHGDFALAGVACTLSLATDGLIAGCRLALTGVGLTPVRATEAEAKLLGVRPSPAAWALAAEAVRAAVDPESDVHGTAEYRRDLAGVLTERALARACERATGGGRP